jgi:hypothetical protein
LSAVEFLRIECVEEAKYLNLCSHLSRVNWDCSSRAGECRLDGSLSSKSEKEKVETVASVSAQDPEDFFTVGSG